MARKLKVTLSGPYYLRTFRRLLRDLEPLLTLESPREIEVNLDDLTFLGPAALATTAAVLMQVRDEGLSAEGSVITWPRALGIRSYLDRMDFFSVLLHDAGWQSEVIKNKAEGLLECQHFTKDEQLRDLVHNILQAISEKVDLAPQAKTALDTSLSEILENVLFHADAQFGGIAAVQAFKNGELELAIVDLGVGIAVSLAKNPDHVDAARKGDLHAITTALVPNVTSTPWRNSGWGLAFAEHLLRLNGGVLQVISGTGIVTRGAKTTARTRTESLPGTLVAMRFRLDGPMDYVGAWQALEEAADSVEETYGTFDGGSREAQ